MPDRQAGAREGKEVQEEDFTSRFSGDAT